MKVKISNYPSRLTCNLHKDYMNRKYGYVDWPENNKFERFLEFVDDRIQDAYNVINWVWFDRRSQKVKVRIDPWDTWSMDHTLAPIILPMLVQLKENKHGAPFVDNEDLPKELRMTKRDEAKYKKDGTVDDQFFERWDWVMGEMIYAFDCKANKDDVYMRFDIETQRDEMEAEQKRISNGFRLFGKYFEALWD